MARVATILHAVAAAAALSIASRSRLTKEEAMAADDALLRERRERQKEAVKRQREQEAAGFRTRPPARARTAADEERLRLAAERRARKTERQARGFISPTPHSEEGAG